jgi:hypothetical protein
MGLMVHSLEGIPEGHHRDYYIYLLDYGWNEPLSDALRNNFGQMATLASEQKNAVVIMRADLGVHFSDEVLSWHSINGENAENEQLLPAILITNRHPAEFRRRAQSENDLSETNLKLILFPLKKYCSTTTEVVELIQNIFTKIKQGEDFENFNIVKQINKGQRGAVASSLIIEPTQSGTNIAFDTINNYFS